MESASTQRSLRLVLPIRTSKRKLEAKSPQQQQDLAHAWANTHGHEIVRVLDSGKSESGKTMDRATIHEAMQLVRNGEADGIVFALTDRLGRAPIEESMAWIRQLHLIGHLALADAGGSPVDLSDPNAETNLVMQLQFARQQWLATARRFRQSQRDAIKAGKFIGPTPLGFRRERGRLYECPVNGPIMREAYRLAAIPETGLHLAVDYLAQKFPGRKWNTQHVRRMLASRAYLGENRFQLKGDEHNFEAEELVSPIPHDALTDPATWEAAQTDPRARRSNGAYFLSHVATCDRCSGGMVGALQTMPARRRDPDNWRKLIVNPDGPVTTYRRMRCERCKGGNSIRAERLEEYVREAVREGLRGGRIVGLPGVTTTEAEAALSRARAAQDAFADDLEYQEAFGRDAALKRAKKLREAVEQAERDFRAAAVAASKREEPPTAEEVDDDAKLLRAIRVGVGRISVVPGRGTDDERIVIEFHNPDEVGALAA